MLKYLSEFCFRYPVGHGLILFYRSAPLRISPSSSRRRRVEVAKHGHLVTFLSSLCYQIPQCLPDKRTGRPVRTRRNVLVDSNKFSCGGGVRTGDLDALYAACYRCAPFLLTDFRLAFILVLHFAVRRMTGQGAMDYSSDSHWPSREGADICCYIPLIIELAFKSLFQSTNVCSGSD